MQSPWHADIRRLRREIDADENENAEDIALCDVPFAKDWHELAIKASIWLGIKQGHTRIGFTTGTQQCDRWWDMEGLMHLYDQLVPKSLKKVAALSNSHNGWATINTRTPTGRIAKVGPTEWQVQDGNHKMLTPPLKNKDVALFYLNEHSKPAKEGVRVLHISPSLKEAVAACCRPLNMKPATS